MKQGDGVQAHVSYKVSYKVSGFASMAPRAMLMCDLKMRNARKRKNTSPSHPCFVSVLFSWGQTNLANFRWANYHVIRRFTDFVWLHDRLADQNKCIIVPPLPEKNVVGTQTHSFFPSYHFFLKASKKKRFQSRLWLPPVRFYPFTASKFA